MEFITELAAMVTGLFDFIKGTETVQILNMVKEILVYVKEFEAAGIIEIIQNFIAYIPMPI